MSNSSPLEPTPPDLKASAPSAFAFSSGDDAALRQWEVDQKQARLAAATARDDDQITTTFSSDPSGTTSSSSFGAAKPTIAVGDVPHLPVPASIPTMGGEDIKKLSSAPSQVAIELEKVQPDGHQRNSRQDIYLPAQDLLITVRYLRKDYLQFTLFLLGSILTAGILPLIVLYWVPRIYRQWIYRVREAPTEDELARGKAMPCLVEIPSEPASLQKLEPHKLPSTSSLSPPPIIIDFSDYGIPHSAYESSIGTPKQTSDKVYDDDALNASWSAFEQSCWESLDQPFSVQLQRPYSYAPRIHHQRKSSSESDKPLPDVPVDCSFFDEVRRRRVAEVGQRARSDSLAQNDLSPVRSTHSNSPPPSLGQWMRARFHKLFGNTHRHPS